ncbi:hypothetical protein D3P08_07320 [Paenibacillus nanensis]|uniref:Signal transduction histidine kinase n=1 Tax=Paenibacillus nanensis TaxID=393251 RepID=A0A3A1V0J4_9BACL|nr:hypothetical protein [Paenibacillus nanensis]RIX54054.1 hypothetical protein D3P08_07320 [Paenibacillus nanensis]
MDMATSTIIFIIAAFALGAVTIMKRDSLPPKMRRGLALISLVMIAFAFFLIVYALFTMGEGTL